MKAKGVSSVLLYFPGGGTSFSPDKRKLVYGETENRIEISDAYLGKEVAREVLPPSPRQWSDQWKKTIRLAARECGRLGVELGISIGGAGCENRNVSPEHAEKTLVVSATPVHGGAGVEVDLPLAKETINAKTGNRVPYHDLFVLALPAA